MNNLFIEGPIQTGKSTLIREILRKYYSASLDGGGDDLSCDHTTTPAGKAVGGFTVQRINFPTQGSDKRFGFRLMEASAPIHARTCVVATDDDLINSEGMFKLVSPYGSRTNMTVFETKAVDLMDQALNGARAGRIGIILLDEIGGHELTCRKFCQKLYALLDSDIPCVGVIKHPDSARRMDSSIAEANEKLHKKITGLHGELGEILYYECAASESSKTSLSNVKCNHYNSEESIRTALEQFIARTI